MNTVEESEVLKVAKHTIPWAFPPAGHLLINQK